MDGDVGRENKVVGSLAKTDGSSGVGQGSSAPAAITAPHAETSTSGKNGATFGRPDDGRADDGHG